MIDHGTFTLYQPDEDSPFFALSQTATPVLFCRNEQGVDWYTIVQSAKPGSRWQLVDAGGNVCANETDPSKLWPLPGLNVRVIEIPGD
jgi:hypothetical protein